MTIQYPMFKAAACHASSVFLDAEKTAEKACDLIAEASRAGAELVAFPKSFLPGFPIWAALQAPIYNHGFFRALVSEAQKLADPSIRAIRMARAGMVSLSRSASPRVPMPASAASGIQIS